MEIIAHYIYTMSVISNLRQLEFFLQHVQANNKNTSRLYIFGLCKGHPIVGGGFPYKEPVMHEVFPFDDVIMSCDDSSKPMTSLHQIEMYQSWFQTIDKHNPWCRCTFASNRIYRHRHLSTETLSFYVSLRPGLRTPTLPTRKDVVLHNWCPF